MFKREKKFNRDLIDNALSKYPVYFMTSFLHCLYFTIVFTFAKWVKEGQDRNQSRIYKESDKESDKEAKGTREDS